MVTINHILKQGKNESFEFKISFSEVVIETLVAFANATGGSVYIGVSDDGKVIGVKLIKESLQKWTNEIKQKTTSAVVLGVALYDIDSKTIVELSVSEYTIKPVSVQGRYYKRVQNANHLLSPTQISDLHLKIISESWDYYLNTIHDIAEISIKGGEIYSRNCFEHDCTSRL